MHPGKNVLKLFIEKGLADLQQQQEIESHVRECEFCREFCDEYRIFLESMALAEQEPIPERAKALAERLYNQTIAGLSIPLKPMVIEPMPLRSLMAADTGAGFEPDVICLGMMYSEDPELVLRIMQDRRQESNYLQLISADPQLVANVLIRLPQLGREFLTDSDGRAECRAEDIQSLPNLEWQIKMPESSFRLEPLIHDPEKVEYAKEMILETERHDKIQVTFEGKVEGKQITIRVLQLNGRSDFQDVKVTLLHDGKSQLKTTTGSRSVSFALEDSTSTIGIRLFM